MALLHTSRLVMLGVEEQKIEASVAEVREQSPRCKLRTVQFVDLRAFDSAGTTSIGTSLGMLTSSSLQELETRWPMSVVQLSTEKVFNGSTWRLEGLVESSLATRASEDRELAPQALMREGGGREGMRLVAIDSK
jgi:hypothetical protein